MPFLGRDMQISCFSGCSRNMYNKDTKISVIVASNRGDKYYRPFVFGFRLLNLHL